MGWLRRADRAGGGTWIDLGLYALSAVFAWWTAAASTLAPHRAWGSVAAPGYAVAAAVTGVALAVRRPLNLRWRAGLVLAVWLAACLAPLLIQTAQRSAGRTDRAQEEVVVIEHGGQRLLDSGTPYLTRAEIAAQPDQLLGYLPYQPGMATFGLPRALDPSAGWWSDARIWFAAVAVAAVLAAARRLARREPAGGLAANQAASPAESQATSQTSGQAASPAESQATSQTSGQAASPAGSQVESRAANRAASQTGSRTVSQVESRVRIKAQPRSALPEVLRGVQAVAVLPLATLTLATGGDDLPVLALSLLALALAAPGSADSGRPVAAGLAIGAAAALKLFAWPIAVVLAIYFLTSGGRAGRRYLAGAIGVPVVTAVPALATAADALWENVIVFPFGHGLVASPAGSPLPGHLIATLVPAGRPIATALLLVAALGITWLLVHRPPRSPAMAAAFSAGALLAAMLLLPSTRFGYLLYPVALLAWVPALRQAELPVRGVA